ncbi:MAG: type I restriction enzyme, S subunit [bacterium F082]|nr:MAG: type I restriction enzyme, S subunit [bacterium F082]KWW30737.1 MAG: type I restriction enzyme, S subunit [bacterium P201]
MKQGWQIYKLEDICTIYDKLRKPISKKDRVSGIYPYYGASCVQDYVNDYLFDGRYVLIGEDGAKWGSGEDTAYIVEGKFWVNNHAHIIQCNNGIVDTFIYYYFNHLDLTKLVAGAIIPKLTQETLRSMEIPIPPLSEQQRIVSLLDAEFAKIDALKANAEKNLQNAKDLFQAALKKELEPKEGWITKRLNDIYDVRDGTHDSPKYHLEGYPLVTSKNLRNGMVEMDNVKYISKEDYDKINERSKVDIGDVLFAMIGTIGNPSLVTEEPHYAIKNMALFKVPKNQSGALLRYVLSSDGVLNEMHKKAKGSNQPFVSLGYLRNFVITIPESIEEQNELVARLDALNEKCKTLQANYEKTLSLCDDLKQALLRKAFNGEI